MRKHRDMITVREAADILDVSGSTVRRWLHAGDLEGTQHKRIVRVFEDSVYDLIDDGARRVRR